MAYHLMLVRPRYEGYATRTISALPDVANGHDSFHPIDTVNSLWHAQDIAYRQFIDPRDSWNNTIVDITYPKRPDPRNPNNQIAIITGYILVRFADPTNPLPEDVLRRATSNIRYLTVFSHEIPDPAAPSRMIDIFKPYIFSDDFVKALPATLTENRDRIISSLIGRKVRIPSGLCMGMTGKIKKITPYPDDPNNAIVLLKVMHDGVFSKTYLSFTLAELS